MSRLMYLAFVIPCEQDLTGATSPRRLLITVNCQPVVAHEVRQPRVGWVHSAIMLECAADGVHLGQDAGESGISSGAVYPIAAPPWNRIWMLPALLCLVHQVGALLPTDLRFLQRDRTGAARHHPRRHSDEIVVTRERGLRLQMGFGNPCRQIVILLLSEVKNVLSLPGRAEGITPTLTEDHSRSERRRLVSFLKGLLVHDKEIGELTAPFQVHQLTLAHQGLVNVVMPAACRVPPVRQLADSDCLRDKADQVGTELRQLRKVRHALFHYWDGESVFGSPDQKSPRDSV